MIHKDKSNKQLMLGKLAHESGSGIQSPLLKGRWDQTAVKSKSNKSLYSKCSASPSKSKGKEDKKIHKNKMKY